MKRRPQAVCWIETGKGLVMTTEQFVVLALLIVALMVVLFSAALQTYLLRRDIADMRRRPGRE
jgi:hypothetical protein